MVAGDIASVKITNPNLGSKTVYPVSSSDGSLQMGGYKSVDDITKIDNGGRIIDVKNIKRSNIKVTCSWDMNDPNGDELSFFTAVQSDTSANTFTVTHINGSVWTCTGAIVGDNEGDLQNGQIELTLQGNSLSKVA